jgi:hypothetical protein
VHEIMPKVEQWFLARAEYFQVFAAADSRLESWFKAELLVLFNRLAKEGAIDSFERGLSC